MSNILSMHSTIEKSTYLFRYRTENIANILETLRGASESLINRRVTDNQAIMSIQLMTLDQIFINVPVSHENC